MSQENQKEFDSSSFIVRDVSSPVYPIASVTQESQSVELIPDATKDASSLTGTQNGMFFHASLALSDRDRDLVLSALSKPPELNETLKLAIKRFCNKYAK